MHLYMYYLNNRLEIVYIGEAKDYEHFFFFCLVLRFALKEKEIKGAAIKKRERKRRRG